MFETISFESILQRMLSRVPNNIDKREGSIIHDALAPAAVELQEMYIALDVILSETFADTATRDFLIKRAMERGITPNPATHVILRGEFNIDVPIGSRFSLDIFNYVAVERISNGVFKMMCETPGANANMYIGRLIPIGYIDGLTRAELIEVLIPGEDEELTEDLRKRYMESLNSQSFGGNIVDYKNKTNALPGVGGVKVYPVWNGGGTVKLVIIDSQYQKPSVTLINDVQTQIDPTLNLGEGLGIAPIGHVVTVKGVDETIVNIKTNIAYQSGWTWEDIKINAEKVIDDYFLELNKTWADETVIVIRISQIETRLLNLDGIIDISKTSINDVQENLILDKNSIVVRGDVSDIQ